MYMERHHSFWMDITTSSKSYHLGTAGTDTQLKTRKITTEAFAVYMLVMYIIKKQKSFRNWFHSKKV